MRTTLASALTLVVVGGGAWLYLSTSEAVSGTTTESADVAKTLTADTWSPPPLRETLPGIKEYRHLTYHFSLLYPEALTVTEYKEKGTALTVTFQDPSEAQKSFQIFIVPYGEKQITPERFRQDVPSGVRLEPTEVSVDGVSAVMFFSENSLMGETREVWFIKNGFLYEVTTYKELDSWLAGIISTWEFL